MRNLAGVAPASADDVVLGELEEAGVPAFAVRRAVLDEVKTCVVGRLGDFTFERAWVYWRVRGPMPVDAAERLNKTHRDVVRVRGHAKPGVDVSGHVTWRAPNALAAAIRAL